MRQRTFDIERKIALSARQQFGLFTLAQAVEFGVSRQQLDQRVRAGTIHRLFPGVFQVASSPRSPHQRMLAAWLASEGNVCIARRCAASIHGFPAGGRATSAVELLSFGGVDQPRKRVKGIDVRRTTHEPRTQAWNGARITTPAQTICDLAAVLPPENLARCIDHVLAHRLATVTSMRAIVLAKPAAGFKGRSTLLDQLDLRSDGKLKHRSKEEARVARWLRDAGLGGFIPNHVIAEAGDLEVDIAWPTAFLILEISPFHTHGSEAKQRRDIERRRLLAPTRWTAIEVGDADIASKAAFRATIALIRRMMASAA
jgi:Transcriptional regulator, AbiEi antitoxin